MACYVVFKFPRPFPPTTFLGQNLFFPAAQITIFRLTRAPALSTKVPTTKTASLF